MLRLKSNPLFPSLKTVTHQFLQRCSVSGTAKGKAKLKTGQTLLRSKIPKKKGSQPSAPSGGGQGIEAPKRLNNALTPIRHLKAKQRAREAEREKLGLISKDRQKELDFLKKQSKNESKDIMGTPGLDLFKLGLVDVEKIPKYELTVEDGRRLAKEYSRVLMRQHRARRAAEATLLRLKNEAIKALPDNLKAAAMEPDCTQFPKNSFITTLTQPIEGYLEKVREATAKREAQMS